MQTQIHLKAFDDYIAYFKRPEVTTAIISKVMAEGLQIYIGKDLTKEETITSLIRYWDEWKGKSEKPLFLTDEFLF